jgi:hypothetical protein
MLSPCILKAAGIRDAFGRDLPAYKNLLRNAHKWGFLIALYFWRDCLAQVLKGAKQMHESQCVPAIVIHRPGMDYGDALLCLRVSNYNQLVENIIHQRQSSMTWANKQVKEAKGQ